MEKKEFKVGADSGCEGCIFNYFTCGAVEMVAGPCNCTEREDGKNVIFIKAD